MKTYTVKGMAKLSGVSVRTLHHYHDIGLLKPALIGENRYRYYGEDELLRLQQILFYRELGIPLRKITTFLDRPEFDNVSALQRHRARLESEAQRYRQLIRTIDRTIERLRGDRAMKNADLFKGFPPEKQAEYEDWLVEKHGGDMRKRIETSKRHLAELSESERQDAMSELAELEADLADRLRQGVPPDSEALAPLLTRHRAWVALMWGRDCPPEAYVGLADTYLSHPDFRQRHEAIEEGFSDYLSAAMKAYAERQLGCS